MNFFKNLFKNKNMNKAIKESDQMMFWVFVTTHDGDLVENVYAKNSNSAYELVESKYRKSGKDFIITGCSAI